MRHKLFLFPAVAAFTILVGVSTPHTAVARTGAGDALLIQLNLYKQQLLDLQLELQSLGGINSVPSETASVVSVPFYSQFADISSPQWQKVGCGIASVAMLIDYYSDEAVVVDQLLQRGIDRGSYLSDAGWTHAGLINLAKDYGLSGGSHSLSYLSSEAAFSELSSVVEEGPVMVSVHYTFEPTNPIPHLVVVHGIEDGVVYYNDPAEPTGNGQISKEKFKSAWKQRYISIRPDNRIALGE